MLDYVLAALSAVITAFLGFLGWKVTLNPPSKRQTPKYTTWFFILTLSGLVLTIVQGIRGGRAIDKIEENTSLPASLDLSSPEPANPLDAGRKCMFNLIFRNTGPVPTIGEGRIAAMSYVRPVLKTQADQDQLENQFNQFWSNPKSEIFHLAPTQPGGRPAISTTEAPTLTGEEAASLLSGDKVIYVLARATYWDKFGSHHQDFCQQTEPPQYVTVGPAIRFHFCSFGNIPSS